MVRQAKRTKKPGPVPQKPSPVSRISKIGTLKKFPDKEYANSILHEAAKLVAPIIHENKFNVGTLCEMYPKNPNLLGLNVNHGQKILIRLRYHSNDRLFLPIGDIIGTLLHELTHNLFGPHDNKFYSFLDGLKQRFEEIQYNPSSVIGNYVAEEEKLGSLYSFDGGYKSVNDKRIAKLGKPKYKGEIRKLGTMATPTNTERINKVTKPRSSTKAISPESIRRLILEAAERRLKDSKWCPTSEGQVEDVEPENGELDIIEINDQDNEELNISHNSSDTSKEKFKEYKDIIDLTDDYKDDSISKNEDDEVIVIDACEDSTNSNYVANISSSPSSTSSSSKFSTSSLNAPVTTTTTSTYTNHIPGQSKDKRNKSNLLPSFDSGDQRFGTVLGSDKLTPSDFEEEIQYTFSLSPGRTFICDETYEQYNYPRRKMVADLNFDQIIRKGDKIRFNNINKRKNKENHEVSIRKKRLESREKLDKDTNAILDTGVNIEPTAGSFAKVRKTGKNKPTAVAKQKSENVDTKRKGIEKVQGEQKGRQRISKKDDNTNKSKSKSKGKSKSKKKTELSQSILPSASTSATPLSTSVRTKKHVKSIDFDEIFLLQY